MAKKARSPYVGELRDPRTMISTENHRETFTRLDRALIVGIHGTPGQRKGKS